MKNSTIVAGLCVMLAVLGCKVTSENVSSKTTKTMTEVVPNKLGGCVFVSPQNTVEVKPNNGRIEIEKLEGAFAKKMTVYGMSFIAMEAVSDEFLTEVGKTMQEMFPQEEGFNLKKQHEVLTYLAQYKATIPVIKGHHDEMPEKVMEELQELYEPTCSVCDVIMYQVPLQTMEVVEHLLHFVSDIGLHYAFPEEWSFTDKNASIHKVMDEAIAKGFYDVGSYEAMKGEKNIYQRVVVQEFAYWLISTYWNIQETYGPDEDEWKLKTRKDLQRQLPMGFELVDTTVGKIMKVPSRQLLEKLNQFQ